MQLEQDERGWLIRVSEAVRTALSSKMGSRVTVGPVPCAEDEMRHAMAVTRDRFPEFPFDVEGWNGTDVTPSRVDETGIRWSTKAVGSGDSDS
jgi:hypothetical protein